MNWLKKYKAHIIASIAFVAGMFSTFINDVYAFVVSLIPTKIEFEYGSIGAILSAVFFHVCGNYSKAVEVLVILMCFDMVSGILASLINKELVINSKRGWRGVMKKALTLIVVFTAYHTGAMIPGSDGELLKDCTAWFFGANEIISIVENASKCGVPIPPMLADKLEQLKIQKQKREGLVNRENSNSERDKTNGK